MNLKGSNLNLLHYSSAELRGETFENFKRKITSVKIISDCPNNTCNSSMDPYIMFNGKVLKCFDQLLNVSEIIIKSSNNICVMDPLPSLGLEEMCGSTYADDKSHYQ